MGITEHLPLSLSLLLLAFLPLLSTPSSFSLFHFSFYLSLSLPLYRKPKPKPKPKHLKVSPPPPSPPPRPDVQLIGELLDSITMSRYIEVFHQHKLYTVEECYNLSEDDLGNMGITLGGHQHKIIKNIKIKQEEMGTYN